MKDKVIFPHNVLPTPQPEAEEAGMAVTRPRNAKMDAFSRHASTHEAYEFPNACDA